MNLLRSQRMQIQSCRKKRRQFNPTKKSQAPIKKSKVSVINQLLSNIEGVIFCRCGNIVKYAGGHTCETCFVEMQIRWPGHSTRADIR